MEHIKIDRYEVRLENRRPKTYAIAGEDEYPIPDAFATMCDDQHLAITQVHNPRPEVFDAGGSDYYIPLRTE